MVKLNRCDKLLLPATNFLSYFIKIYLSLQPLGRQVELVHTNVRSHMLQKVIFVRALASMISSRMLASSEYLYLSS